MGLSREFDAQEIAALKGAFVGRGETGRPGEETGAPVASGTAEVRAAIDRTGRIEGTRRAEKTTRDERIERVRDAQTQRQALERDKISSVETFRRIGARAGRDIGGGAQVISQAISGVGLGLALGAIPDPIAGVITAGIAGALLRGPITGLAAAGIEAVRFGAAATIDRRLARIESNIAAKGTDRKSVV